MSFTISGHLVLFWDHGMEFFVSTGRMVWQLHYSSSVISHNWPCKESLRQQETTRLFFLKVWMWMTKSRKFSRSMKSWRPHQWFLLYLNLLWFLLLLSLIHPFMPKKMPWSGNLQVHKVEPTEGAVMIWWMILMKWYLVRREGVHLKVRKTQRSSNSLRMTSYPSELRSVYRWFHILGGRAFDTRPFRCWTQLNLNGYCIHKRWVVSSLCTVLSMFYVYFSVFCKQYMHGFCYIICFGEFTSDIVFILHTCYIYPCNNFATCYNIVIFLLDGTVECTQLSSNDIEEPRLAFLIDNLCL